MDPGRFPSDFSGHSSGFFIVRIGTTIETLPRSTSMGSAACRGVPKDALAVQALHVIVIGCSDWMYAHKLGILFSSYRQHMDTAASFSNTLHSENYEFDLDIYVPDPCVPKSSLPNTCPKYPKRHCNGSLRLAACAGCLAHQN